VNKDINGSTEKTTKTPRHEEDCKDAIKVIYQSGVKSECFLTNLKNPCDFVS
jgi:hypothetical protein